MNTIKKSWPVFVLAVAVFCGALVGSARATYSPSVGHNLAYGDGSDGSVTFDGSTTILGLVPSSNVYTLNRPILPSSMTLNSGVTIVLTDNPIFVQNVLTLNGTISSNGGNASGATGGAASGIGLSARMSTAGGTGIATALTSGAGSFSSCGGGGGGGGGKSDGTTQATGAAAQTTNGAAAAFRTNAIYCLGGLIASSTPTYIGSVGGSASAANMPIGALPGVGSGDGTNAGGGGGGAGGCTIVHARQWVMGAAGSVQANGGNGGNGAAGTAGGGGGGGGGVVHLLADSYQGTAIVSGTNATATGGTHGNGSTTAGNGGDGLVGSVYILTNQ